MRNREFGPRPSTARFSMSCIVPVYNEGELIETFLECLYENVSKLTHDVEIIVVNDGSTDNSADEIQRLAKRLPLHYIELSRNFGKELALQAGLDAAEGDCVVMLDADFQHPISVIAAMVERWRAGVDMVYAVKANRKRESLFQRWGSKLFYSLLMPRGGARIPADAGDFRLLDRKVVKALRAMPERNRFMKGMYAWVGFKSEAIEIHVDPRLSGESKFGMWKLANLALTGLTAFSNVPLRLVTGMGMLISVASVFMGMWIVFEKLFLNQPIPGFATLAAAIFFFAGIQLIAVGVVGEYVGRIFEEVKQRPRYLVANEVNTSSISVMSHGAMVVPAPRRRRSDIDERISA